MSHHSAVKPIQFLQPVPLASRLRGSLTGCCGTIICTLAAVIVSSSPMLAQHFEMNLAMVLTGAWWQIFTGHFSHWSLDHLFWDIAMFASLGAICEKRDRTAWWICVFGSIILISPVLLVLTPELDTYRGISGIDSALFAWVVTDSLKDAWQRRERTGILTFIGISMGFASKLGYEAITGTTFFVDSAAHGFVSVVEAHIVGAIIGALVAAHRQRRNDT